MTSKNEKATTNLTLPVDSILTDDSTLAALETPTELIVDKWGAFISKTSERLRVTHKSLLLQEAPLHNLKQVLVTSNGVSLSSDVVQECAKRGIGIHFLDFSGKAYASLFSAQLTGTVKTRRAQLLAYTGEQSLILGKAFALGKVRNQLNVLRYMNKNRGAKNPALFEEVRQATIGLEAFADDITALQGNRIDDIREQLLSLEGRAAQLYWQQFKNLLVTEVEFPGRHGQGATDLINSMLNYGYGVLYTRVEQAIMLAGLDPFAGFTHTDRSGKASLVYDLVEEFRQAIVDRTVLSVLNLGTKLEQEEDGRLSADTRRLLAGKIMERLTAGRETYERKRQTLQFILYSQARHIATFVRGELGRNYEPFICGW